MSTITPFDPDDTLYIPMRSVEGTIRPARFDTTTQHEIDTNIGDRNVGDLSMRNFNYPLTNPV